MKAHETKNMNKTISKKKEKMKDNKKINSTKGEKIIKH
jgi:hypothetical protein